MDGDASLTPPLTEEELARLEERTRPRPYAGPPDEACRTGDCGGCERCWGPSVPVFGVVDVRRLIADLHASREKIKNLEDDVRYWQQEAESRG